MKNKILLSLLVVLVPGLAIAQHPVWELPLKMVPQHIQTCEVGDSIFLLLKEAGVSNNPGNVDPVKFSDKVKAFWIDQQGTSYPVMFPDLNGNDLIGITREPDGFRFYYFSKRQTIQFLKYTPGGNHGFVVGKPVSLQGRILAAFIEGRDLNVLAYEKKERVLKYIKISGDQIIKESALKVIYDLSPSVLKAHDIAYIPKDAFVPFSAGVAKVKIYRQGDIIMIIVDETGPLERRPGSSVTSVYQWDTTSGKVKNYFVMEPERYNFCSFFFDGNLYRTINHPDRFQLQVYDSMGKKISTTAIFKNDSLKERNLIFREGRAHRVSLDGTVYSMMKVSDLMKAALVVEKTDQDNIAVTWGAYHDDNGVMSPVGVGVSPLLGMATMIAGTIVKQSMDGPGISRYFYLSGRPKDGFRLPGNESGITRAKIDSYEISQGEREIRFKYKAYLKLGADKAGLYYDQTSKKLLLVRF